MPLDDTPISVAHSIIDAEPSIGPNSPPADSPPPHAEEPPEGEENGVPTPPDPQPLPIPEPDPVAIAAEAEKLKEQGNDSFKVRRYSDAIDLYTQAIGACTIRSTRSQGGCTRIDVPTDDPTIRPGPHRARLSHEPRRGVHRPQALPLRARGLSTRSDATSIGVPGQCSAAQDTSTSRAVPARTRADGSGALDAARGTCCGADQRARSADASARARARGAYAQPHRFAAAQGVGHGSHRARTMSTRYRGGRERDPD